MSERKTCPNCKKSMHPTSYDAHRAVCRKMPRPYTVAEEFLNDVTATQNLLARRYGASVGFMRSHLRIGLKDHGYGADEINKMIIERGRINQANASKKRRYQRKAAVPKGYEPCGQCGVLVVGGGTCRICSGKVPCDYHGRIFRVGVGA